MRCRLRQQLVEGIEYAGVADHQRRPHVRAVGHANAHRFALLDQDFRDIGVGEDLATTVLDDRDDGLGNFRRAADRIVTAIKVVTGDQRVDDKAGFRRWQAVVAPLPGQYRDQLLIAGEAFQHLSGGFVEERRRSAVH